MKQRVIAWSVAVACVWGGIGAAHAAAVSVTAVDSGFVTEAGGASKFDGLIVAPATYNYSVGFEFHYAGGGLDLGSGLAPMFRKNYFAT